MFRGLFIGIDRHASPTINWLTCATRDAKALYGLFADTFGGQTVLLTDQEATRARIEQAFKDLFRASSDDLVVIAFSGHGTETHELVTYDSDPANFDATGISLDILGQWISKVPARNLVLILDCCFSGGMGAKGLEVEAISRDHASADARLNEISGTGRLILTASSATERAWENNKLKHGYLTFYLLQALQGADTVLEGGKISVYRLLEYVGKRVADSAAAFGRVQTPTVRGSLEGVVAWPVFAPWNVYFGLFPERKSPVADAQIQSLSAFGFPSEVIAAWAGSIPSLNKLQLQAINDYGLLRENHLVVSAPTSSGKTLIGELAAVYGALDRKRAWFLFPLKALANDKTRHFNQTYGGFGLRTIRVTGDSTGDEILPLMRGQYDIALMTYEKCAAMLLANPYLLGQVGTIVIDEVQMISVPSRGVNLEFLLTLLRLRRREGAEPQIIALSAVIGDTNGFERWLDAQLLRRVERPVPLDEGLIRWDGSFRFVDALTSEEKLVSPYVTREYRKGSSQDVVIPLVRKLLKDGKSVIVFRETKGDARGCAHYLAREMGLPPAEAALRDLPTGDASQATEDLKATLRQGVGFHHADLASDERQVIEEEFRLGKELRVLAATTTLAMGVNTPAEAVIIVGLMHPGNEPYSVAEYKNIVGRAGRLGYAAHGTSYLVALTASDEYYYWKRYVKGDPEPIESRFLEAGADIRSLILRVLATAEQAKSGMRAEDIVAFLEESFGSFLRKKQTPAWKWDRPSLEAGLRDLIRYRLVEADSSGLYHGTELGRLAGTSGTEVESVIRVIDALQGTPTAAISDPAIITATQLTVELDEVLFPINRKSTQKEPQTWFNELRAQGIPATVVNALHRSAQDATTPTLRAKKSATCLMWISGMPISHIESHVTQFGGGPDGAAGPIRSVKSRTCDLLPTVARIAELLHPDLVLGDRIERLLVRLELGVPGSVVSLAQLASDRLGRGDYLQLVKNGITTPEAVEAAGDDEILKHLGGSTTKLAALRHAVKKRPLHKKEHTDVTPIVPPYES